MDFSTLKLTTVDDSTKEIAEKVLYTVGIVTSFWKFVDGFFSYLHKRQRGFISDVVKEELKNELRPLKEDIQEIKENRESDNRFVNQQLQTIISEIKKK